MTKVDHCTFPDSPDGGDADRLKTFGKARKASKAELGKLKDALGIFDGASAGKAVARLLKLPSLRLVAAVDCQKKRPLAKRVSLSQTFPLAKSTHFFAQPSGQVRVWPKEKTGGYRPLCDFPLSHRLLHNAAGKILSLFFTPKPFQYDCGANRKGGVPHLIGDAKSAILAGNQWAVVLDVVQCFQSFTEEGLLQILPFPLKVLRNVALAEHLSFKLCELPPHINPEDFLQVAQQGGPQGSALSALIWTMIVSLLPTLAGVFVLNWADNFLVLGASKAAAEAAAMALIDAVAELPGGIFQLKLKQSVRHVSEGFTALGHSVQLVDGFVQILPESEYALTAEMTKFADEIGQIISGGLVCGKPHHLKIAKSLFFEALDYLYSWAHAFSQCEAQHVQGELQFHVDQLIQHFGKALGITGQAAANYKHSYLKAETSFYSSS